MKIERLELRGYRRLMLSNITKFIYTPTLPYQLILGTNGSGKSSILSELSPLPGNAADFTPDGSKIVVLSHNGSTYELTSQFNGHGAGKHTFIKDGITLNDNGTASVQKTIIEQEFAYSQELHEILIGTTTLTGMPPQKRREWITRLSTADYTFALSYYKSIKGQERDAVGAVKYIKQRLTQANTDLKALPEMDGLDERAGRLRDELNMLLSSRNPNSKAFEQVRSHLLAALQDVEVMSKEILKLTTPQPKGYQFQSLDDVRNRMAQREGEINSTQAMLNHYSREYSDLESIVNSITATGEPIPENIEAAVLELEEEITGLRSKLEHFHSLEEADLLWRDTEQVFEQLLQLWAELPDNTDRKWSRERTVEAREQMRIHEERLDTAKARMSQINARLEVMNHARDSTCPSCGYVWREGYSQLEHDQHQQNLVDHQANADRCRSSMTELTEFLEQSEHYSSLYTRFRGFVSSYPRLKPLWDHLIDSKRLTDNPAGAQGIFFAWKRDVETFVSIEEKQRRIQHLNDLSLRQDGTGHFSQRMAKLHEEIETTTGTLQDLRQDARILKAYHDQLVRLEDRVARLHARVTELQALEDQTISALRNREIDSVVAVDQNELALIQRQLTDKYALDGVISDLSAGLEEEELTHRALAEIAKELSPTEGLIAEQLTGFIGCLVDQLNSIISSIWTYDLQVQACGMDSGELDYKFPMKSGSDLEVSDISKGSTAQKEVINFAFQLTVMLYLNLVDYPLYLDELGAGFDEAHRVNVMSFVKQLMDINGHSQIFMISHYASNHGALNNAETLVLHGANIAVPGEHNKHVVMA